MHSFNLPARYINNSKYQSLKTEVYRSNKTTTVTFGHKLERVIRFELTTLCLASRCSTPELYPQLAFRATQVYDWTGLELPHTTFSWLGVHLCVSTSYIKGTCGTNRLHPIKNLVYSLVIGEILSTGHGNLVEIRGIEPISPKWWRLRGSNP